MKITRGPVASRKRAQTRLETARLITVSLAVLVIVVGALLGTGGGTVCSFSVGPLPLSCPLGFLEVVFAARDPLSQMWPSVALVLLLVILLGRFYCAWVCPTVLARYLGPRFCPSSIQESLRQGCDTIVSLMGRPRPWAETGAIERCGGSMPAPHARYAILGGTLLSSFLFGFPVFCAVCPIGLFFGLLFAVKRLFFWQEPGWELLLFPALLGLELFALRSWCRLICPLGALLGLGGTLNRFLRPAVAKERCLRSRGVHCTVFQKACPEGLDLLGQRGVGALKDCTKCLACQEKCPTGAIRLRGLPSQRAWNAPSEEVLIGDAMEP